MFPLAAGGAVDGVEGTPGDGKGDDGGAALFGFVVGAEAKDAVGEEGDACYELEGWGVPVPVDD